MANLTARRAYHKAFDNLGIQILAVSANATFSQQTAAEALKLPYPLLSDFPERKTIRAYGVLNEKTMTAIRSFFLIDPQGMIRKKWLPEHPSTDVVYSDSILQDIKSVMGNQ
jgi:peroxiredoxin